MAYTVHAHTDTDTHKHTLTHVHMHACMRAHMHRHNNCIYVNISSGIWLAVDP